MNIFEMLITVLMGILVIPLLPVLLPIGLIVLVLMHG